MLTVCPSWQDQSRPAPVFAPGCAHAVRYDGLIPAAYDTEVAQEALADELARIKPWSGAAA